MEKLNAKEFAYAVAGMLLGDATLYVKKGLLRIAHSAKQREYFLAKCEFLKTRAIKYNIKLNNIVKVKGKEYYYDYATFKLEENVLRHFSKFNRMYHEDGKKYPSKYVLNRITPLGILFWYCDDGCLWSGSRPSKYAKISTEAFKENEVDHIVEMFQERFGITARKNISHRKYYIVTFSANQVKRLIDLLRDNLRFIPPSMGYKFDMKYSREEDRKYNFSSYLFLEGSAKHPVMDEDIVRSN